MMTIYTHIKPVLILAVVFLLFSCGGDDDEGPGGEVPNPPRTVTDVINDFKALDIKPGINDLELESLVEGVFWDFRIIVPEAASPTNKRPLVVSLHGAARSGSSTAHQSTACMIEPAFEGKDVFILSPNSKGEFWYHENNQVQILALVDLMTSQMNIDESKTVFTGFSDGGNGSWFYAQYYENMLAAAIPMASSYDSKNGTSEAHKFNVPLYVIHGSADEWFPIAETEGFVNDAVAAGSEIEFVVAQDLIHTEPCAYTDHLKVAVDWLENEIW